jgi:hypothetical protein
MKRRKPPIVLIGVLAISLAIIIFLGMNFTKMTGDPGTTAPPMTEETIGEPRPAPTADEVRGAVKGAPSMPPKVNGRQKVPDSQSTVIQPTYKREKPKPSESSTDSGWYTKEYGPGQKK